jgi:hypothetical protein
MVNAAQVLSSYNKKKDENKPANYLGLLAEV